MDEASLSKIYDPFFTTKEVGKGTGLGLSIVKRVITDHHATLEVNSTPGKGSTFLLHFPIAQTIKQVQNKKISTAILAGGKSSRMGMNKALIELNGKKMIEYVVSIARKISDEVVIIANTDAEYKFLNLPILPDKVKNIGPLGGIHAALCNVSTEQCLVLACDLPFLSIELLRFLLENANNCDIFAIQSQKGIEPLCAVYSKNCLPLIEQQIKNENYRLSSLIAKANSRIIKFDAGHSLYSAHVLKNINTQDDVDTIQQMDF